MEVTIKIYLAGMLCTMIMSMISLVKKHSKVNLVSLLIFNLLSWISLIGLLKTILIKDKK